MRKKDSIFLGLPLIWPTKVGCRPKIPLLWLPIASILFRFICFVCHKQFQVTSNQGRSLRFGMVTVFTNIRSTFGGRRPSVEDDLRWKTTFLEDDLWWKTNSGRRRPYMEDNVWWILACCLVRFAALFVHFQWNNKDLPQLLELLYLNISSYDLSMSCSQLVHTLIINCS